MDHLYWQKPRSTTLGLKIDALPDDHDHKSECLTLLSSLFGRTGNYTEQKWLLINILDLERPTEDDARVAYTLQKLSDVNGSLRLYEDLASLFFEDNQLDAAEDTTSRTIDLAMEEGDEFLVTWLHRILGRVYQSKGEKEKAIHHLQTAIRIASPRNWHNPLCCGHFDLAQLFREEGKFDEALSHVQC